MGTISTQTSQVPSYYPSYPSPTQDPVALPKRDAVGRTAALWLRLCPCLTPASKYQVQPSSGYRQGGVFTTNLATVLCHCLLPVAHLRPRCSTETSLRRPYKSAMAPSLSVPNTCKQESGSTQLGVPTWGRFQKKTSQLPSESLIYPSPTPRPRCSTKTSRIQTNSSATAPSSSIPYTCKQE